MAKYFLAVSIVVCTVLLGAAVAQEQQQPPPKPQEKATQQKAPEKAPQPKPPEQAPQPEKATQPAKATQPEKAPQPEKAAQPKPDQENAKPALAQAAGDLVSIDAMKNELVIRDNTGVEAHILITPATTIIKGGKPISIADIKAGDKITSEWEDTADGFKEKTI